MTAKAQKTLFVMGGGGLPGMDLLVGMLSALEASGIRATHVVGTSAGAVIGSMYAAGYSPAELEHILRGLRDEDVIHKVPFYKARLKWIKWWLKHEPIRALLEQYLPDRFNGLPIRFSAVATEVETGQMATIQGGALVDAVLASMSICGVFPYVELYGKHYSDGGTAANLPLPANWREFDRVYLLIPKRPLDFVRRDENVVSRMLYNADLFAEAQVLRVLNIVSPNLPVDKRTGHRRARFPGNCAVVAIRPEVSAARGTFHFDHDLIDAANVQAMRIINEAHWQPSKRKHEVKA